jgi:hypothetical protein
MTTARGGRQGGGVVRFSTPLTTPTPLDGAALDGDDAEPIHSTANAKEKACGR